MGYLTTITIYNDSLGKFEQDPKAFGEAILKGIYQAQDSQKEASMGGIICQPPRHADDNTLYLHYGNTVTDLNCREFQSLCSIRPDVAKTFVQVAKTILTWVNIKRRGLTKE